MDIELLGWTIIRYDAKWLYWLWLLKIQWSR